MHIKINKKSIRCACHLPLICWPFLQAKRLFHRKIHESGFYLSDKLRTLWWKCLHNETHSPLTSRDISTSSKNLLATISKASSGQAYRNSKKTKKRLNQHRSTLMVQHNPSFQICRHVEEFSFWNCKQITTFLYAYCHYCGGKWECHANIDQGWISELNARSKRTIKTLRVEDLLKLLMWLNGSHSTPALLILQPSWEAWLMSSFRKRLHLKSFLKDSNLKPVDCTAVDQRRKHSESVSESITDRTHA